MSNDYKSKAFTAGNFSLILDDEGNQSTAYLKTVDGGFVNASIVDEPVGGEPTRVKHTSVASITPISCEFGLSGAWGVLQWIQESWNRDFSRRNGSISHADFNLNETYYQEFSDALITETTFPALDGGSKDPAMMKMKFLPERLADKKKSGTNINDKNVPGKQKKWLCSGFRFSIDGIDDMAYVNKIESFTIKQGIKQYYTGADRFPQIEPTKIEFPNISCTIAQGNSQNIQKWYADTVNKGMSDPKAQRSGSLEFLGPDRAEVLFRINLFHCGLLSMTMQPSTANSAEIKRMKFEIFVSEMKLDGESLTRG
ncbi:MAG TPA: phage tail protein [Kofleriaceae bacterium]|jgi:hypothetical protein|nr:phage tail protein [Kofleriaceae bacterium]